ncbi:MAG: SIR2 family protein, partial [Caulobacterales bacterium]|nr:SIR2 family protein [Caulobacterales bacterium]
MSKSPKRVFILGAGFSKAVGLPLATELTTEVLGALVELRGGQALAGFADQMHEHYKRVLRLPQECPMNIEQFYECIAFRAELATMHAQLLGTRHREIADDGAQQLRVLVQHLDEQLVNVLLRFEDCIIRSSSDAIARFVRMLRPSDTVITFNYDRLVERYAKWQTVPWTYGFGAPLARTHILKLHGSIDW